MTCRYPKPLPPHTIAELVGQIKAVASLARIEADSAQSAYDRISRDMALTVAEAARLCAEARQKRERADWMAGVLANAERDAAALRELAL